MGHDRYGLEAKANQTPIFSTHEHHREDEFHAGLNLDRLFLNSYVNWCSRPSSSSPEDRRNWLDSIRTNSYFVWLEKSLMNLYGCGPITEDNWDEVSASIADAHRDPGHQFRILKEKAGYVRFIEDSYWDPGSDLSHPEIAVSAYRMDSWLTGFHPDNLDHDGRNPRQFTKTELPDLEAYEAAARSEMDKKKDQIVAIKCAVAYERAIRFPRADKRLAAGIFGKPAEALSEEEKRTFGNYMFHFFLDAARERDLPIQIHTGLAQISGSNPMMLEPVIAENPDVKFVLFHGGFPWIYEIAGLAHNYPNVYIDMNWLPLISTKAAETALHTYLEVARNNNRISWGGDCWTSEEAYGASMAFRHVLARVLEDKVASSMYRQIDAELLIEKLLYQNAKSLYIRSKN